MAEFTEVMRQWGRLCRQHCAETNDQCDDCVIGDICYSYARDSAENAEAIENAVMEWAKEHPEPVYPTWGDWLAEMGLIRWNDNGDGVYSVMVPTFKMCKHIPADVAEKLGIEPKEDAP